MARVVIKYAPKPDIQIGALLAKMPGYRIYKMLCIAQHEWTLVLCVYNPELAAQVDMLGVIVAHMRAAGFLDPFGPQSPWRLA